jgi:hypothetical protein
MFLSTTTTVVRTGETCKGELKSLSSLRLVWLVICVYIRFTYPHTHPHALVFASNGFDMVASTHFSRDH